MIESIFIELGIIIIMAVVISAIMRLLKQPLIIGYIITGILVSPPFFNLIKSQISLSAFADMGIALLLFMVGLNLNPSVIKEVGLVSLLTGIGQFIFTAIVGYFILIYLGFSTLTSVYISVAITFSSTIIIMKLLSDKGELDTLYGKISTGFLIVQDFIVILALLIISAVSNNNSISNFSFEPISGHAAYCHMLYSAGRYSVV